MLNYLGPNLGGQGPVATSLPSGPAGTMLSGVPGVPPAAPPVPSGPMPHGHAIHGHGHASPAALAAITQHAPVPGLDAGPPPPPEYGTTTQVDGSILLHLKNPDGSLGPVVKVIPPIKRPGAPAPA